ncbi:MAG TPA: wax ester/triacylglycerol synthase family O-acyltransferase [Acidimicrobiales bacterium]|nr:wax ester/triacylglycerol synthase family O-acyltransferase [Acidimicrobiales bacterium]
MDRLSPLDASFLHLEDGINHMHIGSVAVFDGPPPPYRRLVEALASRLPLLPRYRQTVRFVPLGLGRPVWVDDPHFNLEYHLRHTALPKPGGDDELRDLVGRLMSQELDRSRPLWEVWMVEGLGHGRWALVSKVHHCMVDGVAGTDLLTVTLDADPEPAPPPPDDWSPERQPGSRELMARAVAERAVLPYEMVRSLRSATRGPRQALRQLGELGGGLSSLLGVARPSNVSSINGPIGPHRRWDWARTSLADVRSVRSAFGGTVNDVVLAAITGGFRDLLLFRGEEVAGRAIRTLVPVSVRAPGERGVYNNQVSAMFAELPVGIADPVDRLNAVRAQMQGLKESKQAVAGESLVAMAGFAPPLLLSLGARVFVRLHQHNVNTVTTNVPGPQWTLYALGRPLVECLPYVPLAGSVRVGVAIFSYNGTLAYGVTGDYDAAPDIGVLCRGIEQAMADLVSRAGAEPAPAPSGAAANGSRRQTGSRAG